MEKNKERIKDIPGYSGGMFWFGCQIRNLFEDVKGKIKNLIFKK